MSGGIFQVFRWAPFKLRQTVAYIQNLFSAGEQGAWYDPSDLSTLFQDSAGTVPVTAVEQPVGKMLDKSGRGNHATQATTTKRPTLTQDANGCYYLSFDGVDDALETTNIDFTGTDKMTGWAGLTKFSAASSAETYGLGANPTTLAGSFMFRSSGGGGQPDLTGGYVRGTSPTLLQAHVAAPAPVSIVHSLAANLGGGSVTNRVNGVTAVTDSAALGGAFGNYPLYIGARAGTALYFNGRLYSLIVRGAQSSLSQIEATELYIKQKMMMP